MTCHNGSGLVTMGQNILDDGQENRYRAEKAVHVAMKRSSWSSQKMKWRQPAEVIGGIKDCKADRKQAKKVCGRINSQ